MYDIKAVEFGQQQQQQQNSQPKYSNNNSSGSSKKRLTTSATPPPATAPQTASTAPSATPTKTRTCDSTPTASANYFLTNLSRSYSTCHVLTPKHPEPSDPAAKPHQYFNHHHPQHQQPDKVNIDINTGSGSNGSRISSITGGLNDFSSDCSTSSSSSSSTSSTTHMTLLSLRRRRVIQRHACLISIVAAFTFGLVLGVLMPMFGLANVFGSLTVVSGTAEDSRLPVPLIAEGQHMAGDGLSTATRPPSDFPTIYELRSEERRVQPNAVDSPYSVAFIKEQNRDLSGEEVFRNAFHLQLDKNAPEAMIVKKLDSQDHSIKEFRVQRTHEGRFRKGPERRISKPSLGEQSKDGFSFVPLEKRIAEKAHSQRSQGIIKEDIYWGDAVERALPQGFSPSEAKDWNRYVSSEGVVERLEPGCGRMQNRLITFADGTRACARYRQNTDQIQGELFSFYLGQLLGLTNLAPSAPAVINLDSSTWSSAIADITQSQWKQQRPVVLTRWLPDLEPAGIPQPFQPLERHLNKFDVWNITLGAAAAKSMQQESNKNSVAAVAEQQQQQQKGLLKRLEPTATRSQRDHQSLQQPALNLTQALDEATADARAQPLVMQRLIELAQWSDLIVFDYLIANLDRVVNNLYNFQWNADIMAAPAHNLARQINTQLLVFLDNESGLLHGYRLLKKYEAYHGLLLDNLCVFRQPTVQALRELRSYGVGRKLRAVFEETTSNEVRDVLPSLPDKSIKILEDRIDRVLGQVQKCRDLLADR